MSRKLNLDELNKEYVGKTFGWLTVISVYKDLDRKRYYFKCVCKCGKETCKQYDKVISGHTISCGCYKFSKEYSDSLSDYWKDNPDKVAAKTNKVTQWCKENPDKVAERGKKHSQFYKDNPDVLVKQLAKRAETFEKNNTQEKINETLRLIWDDKKRLEFSLAKKDYYESHPEVLSKQSESLLKFYKEHPERKTDISVRNKEWCRANKDKVIENSLQHSQHLKKVRLSLINNSDDINQLIEVLHPSYIESFLKGDIKSTDSVLIKCSVCGKYENRVINNVWRFANHTFRSNCKPVCSTCLASKYTSSYEDEIAEYTSTFYSGELIRNSRDIISPYELDLYYPEKKIAIEFNGDYWHSEEYKEKKYHYNKFNQCLEKGIVLVNIFENEWNVHKDSIKEYLYDLFNNKENKLSIIDNSTINNNYPFPLISDFNYNYNEAFYTVSNKKVYTCGFSVRKL